MSHPTMALVKQIQHHDGVVTMRDRFLPGRIRARQSVAIDNGADETSAVAACHKATRAQGWLMKLLDLQKDPDYLPNRCIDETRAALERGEMSKLHYVRIIRLENGLLWAKKGFIGPIQRKPYRTKPATIKWRANAAAFDEMVKNRPMKPPGR
jgi:hypothetical protein